METKYIAWALRTEFLSIINMEFIPPSFEKVGSLHVYLCLVHRYFKLTYQPPSLLTYSILTPWCRVLLEKLTGLQLVKKLPAFHGTRRFITALTSSRHHYTNRKCFLLAWSQKNIYKLRKPEEAFKSGSNRRSKELFVTWAIYLCCGFLKVIGVSKEFAACILVTELFLYWNNTKAIDRNLVFRLFNI